MNVVACHEPDSPRKHQVLKSILPNRDNRRPDMEQIMTNDDSLRGHGRTSPPDHGNILPPDHGNILPPDHGNILPPDHGNTKTQTVPLLPPDHPHALSSTTATTDTRQGRPTSRPDDRSKHVRSKSTISLRSLSRFRDKDQNTEEAKERKIENKKRKTENKERNTRKHKDQDGDANGRRFLKKTKSTTSLRTLFTKNRSTKDLVQVSPDKENHAPSHTNQLANSDPVATPIWSQFATTSAEPANSLSDSQVKAEIARYTPVDYSPSKQRQFTDHQLPTLQSQTSSTRPPTHARPQPVTRPKSASRPKSFIAGSNALMEAIGLRSAVKPEEASLRKPSTSSRDTQTSRPTSSGNKVQTLSVDHPRPWSQIQSDRNVSSSSNDQTPTDLTLNISKRGPRVMAAVAALNGKTQASKPLIPMPTLDPKAVDAAFEAVLDSRNIPENMRQRMRTLTLRVKADFVRQDQGSSTPSSPTKTTSRMSLWSGQEADRDQVKDRLHPEQHPEDMLSPDTRKSRTRSKNFNLTKGDGSPSKKQKSASRSNSIVLTTTAMNTSTALQSPRTPSSSRSREPLDPEEFVTYLKTVRDPTQVEVGRLHRLRLLLRNETVTWVDQFISLGGMSEVLGLVHRTIAVEWREEHEDQLLHETLLCLKGLCTTEIGISKLEGVADTLFESLLAMLFDEEKKGPSEFNTRSIIVNILFAYLNSASDGSPAALAQRARSILAYLRGPQKPEEAQPVSFVLDMRQSRPYRVWCKEVDNVTREVFWIFLHHLNIIPLAKKDQHTAATAVDRTQSENETRKGDSEKHVNGPSSLAQSYTKRHFPGDRPPVPAAPYIGGVEWDATTYLAAHLDLLNGLVASLPTREERNTLRHELQASGWEKVMGTTLRKCKEKFYSGVHDGLQSWVSAASEDEWGVRFVRYGPNEEEMAQMSPRKSPKKAEAPPKLAAPVLDIPKLSIGLGEPRSGQVDITREGDDGWLM